jgi:tetratricopeptide (TPR) repeat protein
MIEPVKEMSKLVLSEELSISGFSSSLSEYIEALIISLLASLLSYYIIQFMRKRKIKILEKIAAKCRKETLENIELDIKLPQRIFVGRREELAELEQLFWTQPLILITGMAGIGKTTLANQFSKSLKNFRIHQYSFREASLDDFFSKLAEFFSAQGYPRFAELIKDSRYSFEEIAQHALRILNNEEFALFIDDFQKANTEQVNSIFALFQAKLEKSRIVIMSRERPLFLREVPIKLRPLEGLKEHESLGLLRTLVSKYEDEKLVKIHRKVDGHPKALELFAISLSYLSLDDLLEKKFGKKAAPYLIQELWNKISKDEKKLLSRYAVFRKPEKFEALQRTYNKRNLEEVLKSVINKYLLEFEDPFYKMHQIVAEFAYSVLEDKKKYHKIAFEFYENNFISAENRLEAIYHLTRAEETKDAARLTHKEAEELIAHGYASKLSEFLSIFKEKELDKKDWVGICINKGFIHWLHGELNEALNEYEKALAISRKIRYKEGIADSLNRLGQLCYRQREHDKGIEYNTNALEIYKELGDLHGQARTQNDLGLLHFDKGDLDTAREYYEKSIELFEKTQNTFEKARTLGNLGSVYGAKGEYEKALDYYGESLRLKKESGDTLAMAHTAVNIGKVHYLRDENDEAIMYYNEGLEIMRDFGDTHVIAMILGNITGAYVEKGDFEKALEYANESIGLFEQLGDIFGKAMMDYSFADIYTRKRELEKALNYVEKGMDFFTKVNFEPGLGGMYEILGRINKFKGDYQKSEDYFRKSIEIFEKYGMINELAGSQLQLGLLYKETGDKLRAKTQLENSLKSYERLRIGKRIEEVQKIIENT